MCSGKSWATDPYKDRPDVAVWDILDFYREKGCLGPDGIMNWDEWGIVSPQIPDVLDNFMRENKDKLIIIATSSNRKVNEFLSKREHISLELATPDDEILKERAKLKGEPLDKVLGFKETYLKKMAGHPQTWVTPEEARMTIKGYLDGVSIGIIGTAGRKEDETKMSKELYYHMCNHAVQFLRRLKLKPEHVTLISGGAAWADHIAVSLFLRGDAHKLRLHFPCRFIVEEKRYFHMHQSGSTSNYYHGLFSKKMGGDTLEGITKAILQKAEYTIGKDFLDRDKKIAEESDILLAYTWGEGNEPKPGGTKHTWDHCNATVKVHTPLHTLG
jgi:hypothetical protein